VPKKLIQEWLSAVALCALTAAAGIASGGSLLPVLLLSGSVGGGYFLAERQQWFVSSEKHPQRDGYVTAAFSALVLLFVSATGGASSPLVCALYLPILLAALCYGIRIGLYASLGIAIACALLIFSSSHTKSALHSPALSIIFSYPVLAIFCGVLRRQLESRMNALDTEKKDITALLDLSQMMEAAIDLDMTLNLILLNFQQSCQSRVCAVYLKSTDGNTMELRAASGPRGNTPLSSAFPLDGARRQFRGASGSVRDEMAVSAVYVPERSQTSSALGEIDPSAASYACLPLAGVEGLLGMVYVGFSEPSGLSSEVLQRLEQIASYAAFPLQRVLLQQDFRTMAYSDPMTGLDNFRQFEITLADEMARAERYDRPLSLILLDIDHFKSFNDTLGHPAGDALLGQLGIVLQNCLRNVDRPARYGGEEFVVICPETGTREVQLIAERIRRCIAETRFALLDKNSDEKETQDSTTHVTVSLGCATYPRDARTARELVQNADKALYDAKAAGRNAVRVYQTGQDAVRAA